MSLTTNFVNLVEQSAIAEATKTSLVKEAKNNGVSAPLVELFFEALNVLECQALEEAGISLEVNDPELKALMTQADEHIRAAAEDLAMDLKEIESDADALFKQVSAKLDIAAA